MKNWLIAIARKLLGRSFEVNDLEIRFHKEANMFGSHGVLIASNIDQKVFEDQVRFVFVGMTTPPPLTPTIMDYIWAEAQAKGFVVHSLVIYGKTLKVDDELHLHQIMNAKALNVSKEGVIHGSNKTLLQDRITSPVTQ